MIVFRKTGAGGGGGEPKCWPPESINVRHRVAIGKVIVEMRGLYTNNNNNKKKKKKNVCCYK